MSSQYSNPNVNPHFKLPWKPLTTHIIMRMKSYTFISKLCFSILQNLLGFMKFTAPSSLSYWLSIFIKSGFWNLRDFLLHCASLWFYTNVTVADICISSCWWCRFWVGVGVLLLRNTIKVKSSWSVYLTRAHLFSRNWQLPLLIQRKRQNDRSCCPWWRGMLFCFFYSDFTSLSTIFQWYDNSVWIWPGAQCSL